MFARAIAVEYRDRGIRCNAVCPGFIRTPHGLREVRDLDALGVDVSDAAMRPPRAGCASPKRWRARRCSCCQDEASFVNGTQLYVDNGFSAV